METLSNLNTFTQILSEKGYDGLFHTNGAFEGKIKDSIMTYLNSLPKGPGYSKQQILLLTGLLQWNGTDKPMIECHMSIKHMNGKFFFNKMEIIKKDGHGKLIKKMEMTALSVVIVPAVKDAIIMVNKSLNQDARSSFEDKKDEL